MLKYWFYCNKFFFGNSCTNAQYLCIVSPSLPFFYKFKNIKLQLSNMISTLKHIFNEEMLNFSTRWTCTTRNYLFTHWSYHLHKSWVLSYSLPLISNEMCQSNAANIIARHFGNCVPYNNYEWECWMAATDSSSSTNNNDDDISRRLLCSDVHFSSFQSVF